MHSVFVEPANYTQSLIDHVHLKNGFSFSFIKKKSIASDNADAIQMAEFIFEGKSFWQKIRFIRSNLQNNNLIIINGYSHSIFRYYWFLSWLTECYIGIESDTPLNKRTGLKGIFKKIVMKLVFLHPRLLGFPGGNSLHNELFLFYGLAQEKLFLLPMMVDNEKFYSKKEYLPRTASNTFLKLLYVGRFGPEKNIELLIKAFIDLNTENPEVELWIVGDGICHTSLVQLAKNNCHIHFLGKKFGNSLTAIYHQCDILVLPSTSESWGLVINEALSSGMAVICSTAVGAANDLVLKPDSGWVFQDNDQQSLLDVLEVAVNNPDKIKQKAKNGQDFMMNYWNYDLYLKGIKNALEYVAKN